MKNYGQYNSEYEKCKCFWGEEPAKFVKYLTKYVSSGRVLDLGAGEGKNSFFLANLGFDVTAVEVSPYAVKNFIERLIKEENEGKKGLIEKISVVLGDVLKYEFPQNEFEVVISYGFLHCLPTKEILEKITDKTKKSTKIGGINVICTFTDDLPIPDVQNYLNPTLLSGDSIKKMYSDWDIIEYELDIIEHTHPTHKESHKHSLCRLIAKKK